ncbi:leptin receptor isoform X2 [Parambassis ranga]|uniref:Leptin receptor isoform X2 n=1 Tax=Parambassis ranga TaxID=210632 RepID=A0A6P7I076_9TELE|nr:leptin receptor isoform X2 [Parambassis ranga]
MTTTMVPSVIFTVLMYFFLVRLGVQSLEPEDGASLRSGALDLPWQDELCCDSPSAHHAVEGGGMNASDTNRSQSNLPQQRCSFSGSMAESHLSKSSGGTCLDVLCRIDENWENLTCDLQSHRNPSSTQEAGVVAVSLQRLLTQKDNKNPTFDNSVVCEAEDSFMCSVTLDPTTSYITMVTISISDAFASPVLLRIPARPVKPSPPVNVSHVQTIEAELIVQWDDPPGFDSGPLRYQVRYSSNTTHPAWQVVSVLEVPRLSLDLKPKLNYTIQVRCSGLGKPPLWSEWSEPHHIRLDTVSYIPENVVARPGENVTVYCVFNDRSLNANTAAWKLNLHQLLDRSQYRPINQRVSQITVRPSETQMYDLLQCTQEWTIPYSKIYVEGAVIDIDCVTSGDIDSMMCNWTNMQWMALKLRSKWADLQCDEMEEREHAGEDVGEMGPVCMQKPCTIKPLRMNCYKLWLEVQSPFGPIGSKPIYLTPIDHVKPHTPTNVKAVSRSSGVLTVTWEPPYLPAEDIQCQFRYHSMSTVRAQPEWKVQNPVRVPWAEAVVPDMCRGYVVQVRCMHTSGSSYWSEWSDSVYSTPQNSQAPERGPDFWRIHHDDPHKNTSDVTLLFKHLPLSGNSYCVDGFIVQHQPPTGSVIRERVELDAPYSFEWNQELQTVTVEAYNILGSSANNMKMTLEKEPKRRCVRSFHVVIINSTCVSLSWTLLDNSSVPLFMVVQWSLQRQQDSEDSGFSGETWTRLPYTDHPVYLKGDFFGSEEFGFYLYPVFAEGEGEPVYALATRGDPAAYMMLMVISFLSIVLFVTLVISQNQMKKFVWKDVPNPNKCSWAKGLDFKKVDTFDHLFRPAEGLPAWPLLLPSENISSVIIVENSRIQTPLVSLTHDPASPLSFDLKGGAPSSAVTLDALTSSRSGINELQPAELPADSSAQSSVTYSTVLISDPKQHQQSIHLHYKDGGSGNSSSDEGNFSANNSDISGSFACGLWELDSCRLGDDPRRSCSYNSVEELSETSEQEDEGEARHEADLYYLGMDYPAQGESSEEEEEHQREEETNTELLKNVVLNKDDCSVESHPLLGPEESSEPTFSFSPLYMPQFRTAPDDSQHQP